MRIAFFALSALLLGLLGRASDPSPNPSPARFKLLLTPQRLRRMQRDRERQTIRWANFEARVQNAADSAQRGFELALYYAVSNDASRGREAIAWTLRNPCDTRQAALVLDWCAPLITDAERRQISGLSLDRKLCGSTTPNDIAAARDALFLKLALDEQPAEPPADQVNLILKHMDANGFRHPEDVYAFGEYTDAIRNNFRVDIRSGIADFFVHLPAEYLLAMNPPTLEEPGWKARAAALLLVTIDPNLQDSQFLQGWAMGEKQMMSEGDGVAYELLWGNPYLPGVSYQNLSPWIYEAASSRLFARTDWGPGACWIGISPGSVDATQCPEDWRNKTMQFGHLSLIPVDGRCGIVPHPASPSGVVILWGFRPGQPVSYGEGQRNDISTADRSGMLRVPAGVEGKVCAAR